MWGKTLLNLFNVWKRKQQLSDRNKDRGQWYLLQNMFISTRKSSVEKNYFNCCCNTYCILFSFWAFLWAYELDYWLRAYGYYNHSVCECVSECLRSNRVGRARGQPPLNKKLRDQNVNVVHANMKLVPPTPASKADLPEWGWNFWQLNYSVKY